MRRLAAAIAIALLAGCTVDGIAFREDTRVQIVSPPDRADVELPLTIRWTAEDLPSEQGGPYFAVFVDRAPIRPGQSLRAVADDACRERPGCPDLAYLRSQFVYLTDRFDVEIVAVPRSSDGAAARSDRHEATIVLIDANGRRIGEAAYYVEFTVRGAR